MQSFISPSCDPAWNLAWEETVLRRLPGERFLLFYRNSHSVILGRNQNPWAECDPERLAAAGIPVLRRISGGGAVWHGPGNLNYSLVMPRTGWDPAACAKEAATALRRLGFDAGQDARHSLRVGGAKVGGTAFLLTSDRALFHGTLLLDADLEAIGQALVPASTHLEGVASPSVRSPVANLGIPPRTVMAAFCTHFGASAPISRPELDDEFLQKHRTREWLFGRTPPFVHSEDGWRLEIADGKIARATRDGREIPELAGIDYTGRLPNP